VLLPVLLLVLCLWYQTSYHLIEQQKGSALLLLLPLQGQCQAAPA
jgi:hypothetical protein